MSLVTTVVVPLTAVVGGFTVSVLASRRAVANTSALAAGTRIPPFVVGFTLLAIGTDLPEIANSIVAALGGHGDLVVGNSIGSVATQTTLVLGLLPLAGGALKLSKTRVSKIGAATVVALLLGALLIADGSISRVDALMLIAAWVAGSAIAWGPPPEGTQMKLSLGTRQRLRKTLAILVALAVVGTATTIAVWGLTEFSEAIAVPEYITGFFLASVGTSLPELVVTATAMRQGQTELAIGDAMGASLIDATLSVGIGPLLAPIVVSPALAMSGSLASALGVALVTVLLAARGKHDWRSALVLLALYLGFYAVLLSSI